MKQGTAVIQNKSSRMYDEHKEKKRAEHSGREKFFIGRKKVTGFREKPVLSVYSQLFLHPIDGILCPEGRGS